MPITTSDELIRLLQRVARQDRTAFAQLFAATSAKLNGIILRISGRRDIAEEMLQEVYVRIWQRAGDFDPARASPITWMAAIARNRALDEVRRSRPVSIEDHPEALNFADPGRASAGTGRAQPGARPDERLHRRAGARAP